MALLAEQIVQEWLMRNGYFTIRGLRIGNDEMDLLAIKRCDKSWECWHVEVQVSSKPVTYIASLTQSRQKEFSITGTRNAKKRNDEQIELAVDDWLDKKFFVEKKQKIREKLTGIQECKYLLVHGKVKCEKELEYIGKRIKIKNISDILEELTNFKSEFTTGSGSDILELLSFK